MSPKTLYIDIETAPNVAHVWGLWQQNVSLSQLMDSGRVISVGAKWRGEAVDFWSEHEDREGMLKAAWNLMDDADVICHYNGETFDIPYLNSEFVRLGWGPPSPAVQLDLLKVVKKRFRFPSNKLDYVSQALGLEGKVHHEGHELWVKCLAGDAEAWERMREYNEQDVVLLEELHDKLLPWMPAGINLRLFDEDGCPYCGGELQRRGFRYTGTSRFQRYQCKTCKGWSSETRREEGSTVRGVV